MRRIILYNNISINSCIIFRISSHGVDVDEDDYYLVAVGDGSQAVRMEKEDLESDVGHSMSALHQHCVWSYHPEIAAAFALDPKFWNDAANIFKQEFDDEKQRDKMLQRVMNFGNKICPFNSGPFNLNNRDSMDVLWHFDSTKLCELTSGIDNDLIAKLARYAIRLLSYAIDIGN